jgi:tetratricopeptide (TPR) repeat protein
MDAPGRASIKSRERGLETVPPGAPRWHLAAIALATLAVYANALGNMFVWDDLHLVVDNPRIKSGAGFWTLWASDLFPDLASGYYRPLQTLTYWIDYQLWAIAPFGYHLTSTLLHGGVALLLYRLVDRLLGAPRAALAAALLFAVHPLHTEAVTYVSGRSDPLSALFLLAALVLFLEGDRTRLTWRRVASLAAFAAALLSREAAMVGVLLVPLVDLARCRRDGEAFRDGWRQRLLVDYLPYVVVLGLYLGARAAVVGTTTVPTPLAQVPLALRLATMLEVVVRYVALFVAPVGQHMERTVAPAASVASPAVLGAALVVLGGVALAVLFRRRAWPVSFGVAWFLVALLPVANVVPLATFMAEHWLYVPSMGLCLAAGWLLDRAMAGRWRTATAALAALALVAYAGLTMRRNLDWKDGVTLYEATLRHAPGSARALINLGEAYQRLGQLDRAEAAYRRALAVDPGAWTSHNNLGSLYADQGRPDLAEQEYRRGLALAPGTGAAHNNLGNLYRAQRRPVEAIGEFQRALALNPSDAAAHNNLGLALLDVGRPDDAKAEFEAAIRINPDYAAAHSNLGNHYFRRGQLAEAAAEYRAAIRLDPGFANAHNNLGSVYFNMGQLDLAEQAYRRALDIDPRLDEVRRNLEIVVSARAKGPGAPPSPR